MAERLLFAPSLGFALLAGAGLDRAPAQGKRAVLALSALLIAGYGVRTITRNGAWKDNLTLFSRDLVYAPNCSQMHFALGSTLIHLAEAEPRQDVRRAQLQEGTRRCESTRNTPWSTTSWVWRRSRSRRTTIERSASTSERSPSRRASRRPTSASGCCTRPTGSRRSRRTISTRRSSPTRTSRRRSRPPRARRRPVSTSGPDPRG